ncbi:HAD family hydrolase [Pelagibacterium lentulum]|uniref:Haloacid dehalogenase n=1 Tax=Pelagibacterium lentulum TaxID=2029865 RepID=A0A916VVV3_9HYPH|nr:HAD family phosphatase [Pelagibacterium lentulum]GGA42077.1 haloacid dehalogenase [Pelagibacterium lentulum]
MMNTTEKEQLADRLAAGFDAAIFDMDGTLLDTEAVFRAIVFDVMAELGFEMTDHVHRRMVGSSHEATERLLVESYGVAFPYTVFDEKCRISMRARLANEPIPVKRGAKEMLAMLNARNIPTAVATSSRSPHATAHLGAAGLLDHFETIVTRDDVANPKPHPEPYLTAALRLKADPVRCVAFEDSHMGVRAAHAAGMFTIMVPDLVEATDEIAALCHHVAESLEHAHDHIFSVRALSTQR